LDRIRPNLLSSLPHAALFPPSRPMRPISARTPGLLPPPLSARPHLSAALALAPSKPLSLSGKRAPLVSPFLAPVTKLSTRSPPVAARSIASPLTRSPTRFGTLRHRALCPSCPFTRLLEPSRRHHYAPSSPPWQARRCSPSRLPSLPRAPIKGPPELRPSSHWPRPLPLPSPESNRASRHRALPPLR
jgi:hypothetical protein